MESIRIQLKDMGFSESKVNRALKSCPEAQTLEQVMEWLIAHEDELSKEEPTNPESASKVAPVEPVSKESTNDGSHKQKDGANETAANMAARKKITVEEAQQIITERQAKRVEEERKKAIEDEKRRRLDGQKMAETRAELQDQERIHLAQQIRREKLEKEAHRKHLLEQIARDREAMRSRNIAQKTTPASSGSSTNDSSQSTVSKTPTKSPATECKLALRFQDNTSLVHKFSPQEQLSAVRLFVKMEKAANLNIEFIAPPNRKLAEKEMNSTLESLGLCPASRLEVKYTSEAWDDLD